MLTPYPTSPMTLRVSAINIDANGRATVGWTESEGSPPIPLKAGDVVTVPAGLLIKNTQLIWSEVTYRYTPILKYVLPSDINLADEFYTRPRQSTTVTHP